MLANILIAVGFFFAGALAGLIFTASAIKNAEKEDRRKHYVVYEL